MTDENAVEAAFDGSTKAESRSTSSSTTPGSSPQADGGLATADWRRVLDTNLTSAFVVGRAAARRMVPRGRGKVINIGSLTSEWPARPWRPNGGKGRHQDADPRHDGGMGGARHPGNAIGPGYMLTDMNQSLVNDPTFDAWVKGRTPSRRGASQAN